MIAPASPTRPTPPTPTTPNEQARQLTGRDYLSYSAVSTFQQCPLKYHFRYVAGLPEEFTSASLVFGGAIHRAVEHHYRELLHGGPAPTLDALLAAYREGWQEHDGRDIRFGKDDDTTLDDLAARLLAAFQVSEFAHPAGKILGIEEELSGALVPGCPDLFARLDLLVDAGDALIVTDLKTSRSRWSDAQARDAAGQLLLYHELVRPLADGRPVRLEFAVVTKAKSPQFTRLPVAVDPRQLDRTKRVFERVWNAIRAGHFYPNPSALNCPTCGYRNACRAWPE